MASPHSMHTPLLHPLQEPLSCEVELPRSHGRGFFKTFNDGKDLMYPSHLVDTDKVMRKKEDPGKVPISWISRRHGLS